MERARRSSRSAGEKELVEENGGEGADGAAAPEADGAAAALEADGAAAALEVDGAAAALGEDDGMRCGARAPAYIL